MSKPTIPAGDPREKVRTPTRPVLRYHGGKWMLAPWIIEHFPPHRIYVEPFCGAASVLLRKPRSYAETINDLDDDITNLFRVMRDPAAAAELRRQIEFTPWARTEFYGSYEPTADPVERARRTIVRCYMGHGTTSRRASRTGFRAKPYRYSQSGVTDFKNYPAAMEAFTQRLRGVCIENRPALEMIRQCDSPDTLFYVDPPYPISTRSSQRCAGDRHTAYRHEMTDDDHRALAEVLRCAAGMIVLSGYPCDLYDRELLPDWTRTERLHLADGAAERTEVLWMNPACVTAHAAHTSAPSFCFA